MSTIVRTKELVTTELNAARESHQNLLNAQNGLEGKELSKAKGKTTKAGKLVGTLETELAAIVAAEVASSRPSKVARIDQLYIAAAKANGGNIPKDEATRIMTVIKAEYPGINEASTMKTIRCRPWHIRNAIAQGKLKDVTVNKRSAAPVAAVPAA
jgi:hypothetical protein